VIKMVDDSTLPGCFSLGKPLPPNRCETCKYCEDCRKYIRKDVLKAVLARIEEIEQKLKT